MWVRGGDEQRAAANLGSVPGSVPGRCQALFSATGGGVALGEAVFWGWVL